MENRNRSEGWKHAKISGHENEDSIVELIKTDREIQRRILKCVGMENASINSVIQGGLHEKNVASILGGTTKSKTDISVLLSNNQCINISLKKSLGGQVYLISVERFMKGFEEHYKRIIPDNVKHSISLFWGSEKDTMSYISKYSDKFKRYELRKHRVVSETLYKYNQDDYYQLLKWYSDNIKNIFDFCFSRGLAENRQDWAHIIWYKNQLDENIIDKMFNINELAKTMPTNVEFGNKNGGTTIQLPFGFVQWHSPTKKIPGEMQFHHSYEKLNAIN